MHRHPADSRLDNLAGRAGVVGRDHKACLIQHLGVAGQVEQRRHNLAVGLLELERGQLVVHQAGRAIISDIAGQGRGRAAQLNRAAEGQRLLGHRDDRLLQRRQVDRVDAADGRPRPPQPDRIRAAMRVRAGDHQLGLDAARRQRRANILDIRPAQPDQIAHHQHKRLLIQPQRQRARVQLGMNRSRAAVVLEAGQKDRLLTQRWRDHPAGGAGKKICCHSLS